MEVDPRLSLYSLEFNQFINDKRGQVFAVFIELKYNISKFSERNWSDYHVFWTQFLNLSLPLYFSPQHVEVILHTELYYQFQHLPQQLLPFILFLKKHVWDVVWFGKRKQIPDIILSKKIVARLLLSFQWLHHFEDTSIRWDGIRYTLGTGVTTALEIILRLQTHSGWGLHDGWSWIRPWYVDSVTKNIEGWLIVAMNDQD